MRAGLFVAIAVVNLVCALLPPVNYLNVASAITAGLMFGLIIAVWAAGRDA